MKKEFIFIAFLFAFVLQFGFVNATCDLDVKLLNQDPYPAIPGDYVKVVFQINGIQNPECGLVTFKLKEDFPFSLNPNSTNNFEIDSGTYKRDYGSFLLAPYKLRIDPDALDGDNPLEVQYNYGSNSGYETKQFNLNVKDTRADFEVHIKNYNYETKEITFEILNIEDVDIEALTIEIPKQENIEIKGSNINIAGDLDSNEYTTADFEAIPKDGKINLKISYTDSINVRRTLTKQVVFDSSYFEERNGDKHSQPIWLYVLIALIVAWFVYNKIKKNKEKKKRLRERH